MVKLIGLIGTHKGFSYCPKCKKVYYNHDECTHCTIEEECNKMIKKLESKL